jgi:hypothetical protein
MKINYFIAAIFFVGFFTSCGTEEEPAPPIQLQAIITNPSQTVAPFTEVTLDGSTSTGPDGFSYEWIYQGSETVNLSSTTEAIVTFTPEKNAIYNFSLRLTTSDGQFNETSAQITVTGAVVLDASIFTSDNITFSDIEPNPELPDYLVNEDFTIPSGKTIRINSGSIINISSVDEAGIIINGSLFNDGTLYLVPSGQLWKGVLVDGGSINNSSSLYINKAGYVAFSGQIAAGLVVTNNGVVTGEGAVFLQNNNVADYGVIITPTASFSQQFATIQISDVKYPIMTDMGHYSNAIFGNMYVEGYEYIHLTTPGAQTTVGSIDGQFTFSGKNYLIDGDFTAGSPIVMNSGTIYMKEGAGIVGGEISLNSVTIKGMADASWKGIAGSTTVYLQSSSVIGAGSATHDTGSFSTTEKAAIYASLLTGISSSTISNSGGYGVYINSQNTNNSVVGTTFLDITNSDVSVPFNVIGTTIQTGNIWSSSTPVELMSGSQSAGSQWKSLGTGFAYLATSNIVITSGLLSLEPGVHIKFQSGFGMDVHTTLVAEGTDVDPIILEGAGSTAGSWNGVELQGQYKVKFCTINNGGQTAPIGYTDAANVYFGSGSSISTYPQTNNSFENCSLSNSAGYGAAIKLGKYDPVTGTTTNTYTTNASGDIKLP